MSAMSACPDRQISGRKRRKPTFVDYTKPRQRSPTFLPFKAFHGLPESRHTFSASSGDRFVVETIAQMQASVLIEGAFQPNPAWQ